MATILNAYNLTGGDTTSSTFTGSGDCVTVEATSTDINGGNSYLKIQSSDDQSTWKDIGQINIQQGSDNYCNDPIKITGLYVRCLLITNDSTSGTITVTANNPGSGNGDMVGSNNLSDVADALVAYQTIRPYLVYTAIVTQSGTAAPTATELENNLDVGGITFTRVAAGGYTIDSASSVFNFGKMFIVVNPNTQLVDNVHTTWVNISQLSLKTHDSGVVGIDDWTLWIEIRIYTI